MEELKDFKVKHLPPEPLLAEYDSFEERLSHAKKVLIGIGQEWRVYRNGTETEEPESGKFCLHENHVQVDSVDSTGEKETAEGSKQGLTRGVQAVHGIREDGKRGLILEAYETLYQLVKDKDYFIVTTNTDAVIFQSSLDGKRITAPCGNVTWRQCSKACTKDIWEPGEIPDDICPHCGAPMTGNTMDAENYIQEGYLPQWIQYTGWLASTMNQGVLVLELGEGFKTPTVIRWPFEKTVRFNRKSFLYRVNENFAQLAEGTSERAVSVQENSVEWILKCNSSDEAACLPR